MPIVVRSRSPARRDNADFWTSDPFEGRVAAAAALAGTGRAGITGTNGDDTLPGTEGDDVIEGLDGRDNIDGLGGNDTIDGGLGNDDLDGEAGADRYMFTSNPGLNEVDFPSNSDIIRSFTPGEDLIVLLGGWGGPYNGLPVGPLSPSSFSTAPATTPDQRILNYNGFVYYDPDGNGPQLRIEFARGTFSASAFLVVSTGLVAPVATGGDDILTGTQFGETMPSGGGGNDIIRGLGSADSLFGNEGNDLLDGGFHNDIMDGGTGDDVFIADHWNYGRNPVMSEHRDRVIERDGEGYDRVFVTESWWRLDADAEVEFMWGVQFIDGNDDAQTIYGTSGRQIIVANSGDDILNGFEDNDRLTGGAGADRFVFSAPLGSNQTDEIVDFSLTDDVIELVGGPGGTFSSLSPGALPATAFVNGSGPTTAEHRILYSGGVLYYDPDGTGAADALPFATMIGTPALTAADFIVTAATATVGNDNLTGTAGPDNLVGYSGDDILDGGAGVDATFGGTGNDIHYVDQPADTVIERVGQGADEVRSAVSYALGPIAEVEILRTTNDAGTAIINLHGNDYDNTIYGNAGDNLLSGGGGNDFLFGWTGQNTLIGGAGNDTYHIGYGVDTIVGEGASDGLDSILSAGDYTLPEGLYIEVLSTDFHAGTAAIVLGGNALDNVIYGNAGNNILYGKGGNDWLEGLGGDDQYYVDSAGDYVREVAGGGSDRILTGGDYTLYTGQQVEILSTDNNAGTAAIALGGNELDNVIYGNAGANILYGKGGNDWLEGLSGDDSYFVDSAGDYVREVSGGGTDRIYAGADYTLYAGQIVEFLTTDNNAGTANIALGGNEYDNTIYGNEGNNILYGKEGNDTLLGLGGNDQFWFNTALGATNVDSVYGFASGADKLVLFQTMFGALSTGSLSASAFVTGSAAADADDRIIYNSATGALSYDADGNGAGAAIQFATLNGAPVINAGDFSVI